MYANADCQQMPRIYFFNPQGFPAAQPTQPFPPFHPLQPFAGLQRSPVSPELKASTSGHHLNRQLDQQLDQEQAQELCTRHLQLPLHQQPLQYPIRNQSGHHQHQQLQHHQLHQPQPPPHPQVQHFQLPHCNPSHSKEQPRSQPKARAPSRPQPNRPARQRREAGSKNKRHRTTFTPEQLKRLEHEFEHQMYLVGNDRGYLADSLDLSEAQVKVWFQNRRIKYRKLNSPRSF